MSFIVGLWLTLIIYLVYNKHKNTTSFLYRYPVISELFIEIKYSFPIELSWLQSADYRHNMFISGPLSVFHWLICQFYASKTQPFVNNVAFIVGFGIKKCKSSNFVFVFQDSFNYSGILYLVVNYIISLLNSPRSSSGTLRGIVLNFCTNQFRWYCHFNNVKLLILSLGCLPTHLDLL